VSVHFDVAPGSMSASITPAGHEFCVAWQRNQIDVRVTIADPR
jgi:hypothetical protein